MPAPLAVAQQAQHLALLIPASLSPVTAAVSWSQALVSSISTQRRTVSLNCLFPSWTALPLAQPGVGRHCLQTGILLLGEPVPYTFSPLPLSNPPWVRLTIPPCSLTQLCAANQDSLQCCGTSRPPGGFYLGWAQECACGQRGAGTIGAARSASEQFSPPLNETLFTHGPWLPLSPDDEWGISGCNTLFVLEVSVRLKGILHKPSQGVCAYVTRLVRACVAPSSSHCPEWEQSSFEELAHKLSATPCSPQFAASSPLILQFKY